MVHGNGVGGGNGSADDKYKKGNHMAMVAVRVSYGMITSVRPSFKNSSKYLFNI